MSSDHEPGTHRRLGSETEELPTDGAEPGAGPIGARETRAHLLTDGLESPEHLFRRLLASYLAGAEVFELHATPRLSDAARGAVASFVRRTCGLAVLAQSDTTVVLSDRSPGRPLDLELRIARLGTRVVGLHRRAVDQWGRLPLHDDRIWVALDDDVDREAWFLARSLVLGRAQCDTVGESIAGWVAVHTLEQIADHAVTLGRVGPQLEELGGRSPILIELRQLHAQAVRLLEETLAVSCPTHSNELLDVGEALLASPEALSEWLLPAVGGRHVRPATAMAVEKVLAAISGTVACTREFAQMTLTRAAARAPDGAPSPDGRRLVPA